MPTPAEIGLQRWHEVVASRDATKLPAFIAEDAVFRSPAVHTPQEGRDLVTAYLVRWDEDGRIVEFTVMLRPFKALQAVMGRMLEELTRNQG